MAEERIEESAPFCCMAIAVNVCNPEEVDNHKYVTQDELREMMRDEDLLWSPWFRIIEKEFLHTW